MFYGVLIGALSFVIIGVFHPIVIHAHYFLTKKCWPFFLIAGLVFCGVSCLVKSIVASCILAMIGFSCLWSIIELFEQEQRVKKGWFPANPKHKHHCHMHHGHIHQNQIMEKNEKGNGKYTNLSPSKKIKIVILDGFTINPGDLSWNGLKQFGEVIVYDRTANDQVIERIGDADAVLLSKVNITEEVLTACPNIKYIGVLATGYNIVDIDAAKKRGIVVSNVPAYSTNAVVQHVFAFILAFASRVAEYNDTVHKGEWIKSIDFTYTIAPLTELAGKTLGIFGYGSIGKQVATVAKAFGMNVIYTPHTPTGEPECVSVEELFAKSDFVTLHAPLTPETKKIVNEKTISLMKKTAILINTARGPLVDEQAVRNALDAGKIAGFATDVLTKEPMSSDNPLYKAPNCIITPHIAWAPAETRERLIGIVVQNLKAFSEGKPQNVVS